MRALYNIYKTHKKAVLVALLGIFVFTGGVIHFAGADDFDSDGLEDSVDNHPRSIIENPIITSPEQNATVEAEGNGSLNISGLGEVGTQVRVFREVDLSDTQLCVADVAGNGLSFSTTDVVIDGTTLLHGAIVDEIYYDTEKDTLDDEAWRTSDTADWYVELVDKDDYEEAECLYEGASTDCGESAFPERALVIATATGINIFDADARTFWKKIALTNIVSLAAGEGVIYAGTSASGVLIYDFSSGSAFSGSYDVASTHLPVNVVNDLDFKQIGGSDYLAVATASGVTLVDITADSSYGETAVPTVTGVTFSASNKLLFITATNAYLSKEASDVIAGDSWLYDTLSLSADGSAPAPSWVDGPVIGHAQGATEIAENLDHTDGVTMELSYRYITKDYATVPLTGTNVLGHWADGITDRSGVGNDLIAQNSATTGVVATGAELTGLVLDRDKVPTGHFSLSDASFNVQTDQLTVGLWVKRGTLGGTAETQSVLSHGTTRETRDYWISAGDEFFTYGVEEDPYFFGVQTTTDGGTTKILKAVSVPESIGSGENERSLEPSVDTWEFIVGTYDGASLKMYHNGELVNTVSGVTGNLIDSGEALQIGLDVLADEQYLDGSVGLPFIVEEAYSAEQIEHIYNVTNKWFLAGAKNTIQGTSSAVTEVACDPNETNCYLATSDGVTQLTIFDGLTDESSTEDGASDLAPTNMAPWTCNVTSGLINGLNTVHATAYVGVNVSTKVSEPDTLFTLSGFIDTGRANITGSLTGKGSVALEGVSVVFTGTDDATYSATTAANGTYTVSVPISDTYSGSFSLSGYQTVTVSQAVATGDVALSVEMTAVVVSEEEEVPATSGSGKAKTLRWAGMKRGEFKDSDWVPSMTYEESMAQVIELNKGIAAGPIFDDTGRFMGYGHGGRISTDRFKDNRNKYARLRHFDRQLNSFMSQKKSGAERGQNVQNCMKPSTKVGNFIDVKAGTPEYEDVMQVYSLGVLHPDEDRRFHLDRPLGWSEFLLSTLKGECIGVEEIEDLRATQMGRIPGVSLGRNYESRIFYTALKNGIISTDIDVTVAPTRDQALRMLLMIFPLDIDDESRRTSFEDIASREMMAPVLVATKSAGWFRTSRFVRNRFRPEMSITRGNWAAWFSQAYQNRQKTISETDVDSYYQDVLNYFRQEEKEEKDDDKGAYGPQRLSRVSDVDRYIITRASRQKLKDASMARIQTQVADPGRMRHDKTSTRAAIKYDVDKGKNVRRKDRTNVIRDLKKYDVQKVRARKPVVLKTRDFEPTSVDLSAQAYEPTRETKVDPTFGPDRRVLEAGKALQASQVKRRKSFDAVERKDSGKASGQKNFGTKKEVTAPRRKGYKAAPVRPTTKQQTKSSVKKVIPEAARRKRFK